MKEHIDLEEQKKFRVAGEGRGEERGGEEGGKVGRSGKNLCGS